MLAAHSDQQNLFQENSLQSTKEIPNTPAQLSESQGMNWMEQEPQCKNRDKESLEKSNYLITHKKSYFQEYLIEKGLNYQSKLVTEWTETSDLEFCLSMYTDLDVLDEDNKFICQACTEKKQCVCMFNLVMISMYICYSKCTSYFM